MSFPALPSNYANAVAPFTPLGRLPVSEENTELKNSSLKALEESAASGRGENRRSPEDRGSEVEERERTRQGAPQAQERQQEHEQQEELALVRKLAARDREVRMHERAHAAIGGRYASSPRYEYTRGPDGVSYATSGEVSIDTTKVSGDPRATMEKAQLIRRAALAPAEPSSQDRLVAVAALRLELEAKAELLAQQREEIQDKKTTAVSEESRAEADASGTSTNSEQLERQGRQERAEEMARIGARNIESNRRLIEIGLSQTPASGQLLSRRV